MRLRRSRANALSVAQGNATSRARLPPVWKHGLIVGAALAVFGCLLALPSAFWPLQESADLSLLFSLRPTIKPPDDIVLVTIDPQSAQRLSLPRSPVTGDSCADLRVGDVPASHERLPPPHLVMRWPRCVHALAVDALAAAGARVIALDISFRPLNPDASDKCSAPERPNHASLARAISAAGNVLIAQWMDPIRSSPVEPAGAAVADSMHRPAQIDPLIESSALGAAPLRLIYGMSGRVNGFALFSEEETPISSMPALALQVNAASVHAEFYRLLEKARPDDADLVPKDADELFARKPLQATSLLIRNLVNSDDTTTQTLRTTTQTQSALHAASPSRSALSALIDVYTGPALRYLNFYGPAGTFSTLRYADLIADGQRGNGKTFELLRGKTAIVGYVDVTPGQRDDHYPTVYTNEDGVKLSGAEILATAIANVETGSNLVAPSLLLRGVLVTCFGLLLGPLLLVPSPQRGLPYAVALCVVYTGVAVALFGFANRWITVSVPLLAQAPIAILYTVTHSYRDLLLKRDRLRDLFGKFLPDAVIEGLVENQGKLQTSSDPFYGVCVVTDAERFTALAESMHPAKLASLLNDYFEVVFPRITARDGFVIDLLGDAVLAFWRGEEGHDSLHKKSCRAALELMSSVDTFNAESKNPLQTRVGISSGFVTTSPMGAFNHYEFRPVGDAVNTSFRLQELNKMLTTRILVSDTVATGIDGLLLRDVGLFQLRNKSTATHVFELLGDQETAAPEISALCDEFALALAAMRASRGFDAISRFRALQRRHPQDGPSSFYVRWLTTHPDWSVAPIPQARPDRSS